MNRFSGLFLSSFALLFSYSLKISGFELFYLVQFGIALDLTSTAYPFYKVRQVLVKTNFFFGRTLPIAHSIAILTAISAYRKAVWSLYRRISRQSDAGSTTLVRERERAASQEPTYVPVRFKRTHGLHIRLWNHKIFTSTTLLSDFLLTVDFRRFLLLPPRISIFFRKKENP
jgi:hypothetical protein